MKKTTLILLALSLHRVEAQPNVPVLPPPPLHQPEPVQPPPGGSTFPSSRERFPLALTNPGGSAPFFSSPFQTSGVPFQTSGFVQGFTNTVGSTQAINFAITNTLATLQPAQVQAVVQVQVSLNTLQNVGATIGGL